MSETQDQNPDTSAPSENEIHHSQLNQSKIIVDSIAIVLRLSANTALPQIKDANARENVAAIIQGIDNFLVALSKSCSDGMQTPSLLNEIKVMDNAPLMAWTAPVAGGGDSFGKTISEMKEQLIPLLLILSKNIIKLDDIRVKALFQALGTFTTVASDKNVKTTN